VGIAIAGSKVADNTGAISWWLLLASSAVLLAISDVCRQIDESARELVRSAKVRYHQAATDFLVGKSVRLVVGGSILTIALGVWAVVLALALT